MKAGFDTLKEKIDNGEMKINIRIWKLLWNTRQRSYGLQETMTLMLL